MSIAEVEDQIIAAVRTGFAANGRSALRAVESLPADWDDDMFRRLLRTVPGVYVVWGGGDQVDGTTDIESKWVVIAATAHASGELARRRGDAREIGAYEIIERLVATLADRRIGADVMRFAGVENLFTGTIEKQGAAIYAASFTLRMPIAAEGAHAPLHDFVTFHADTDLAPPDGQFEASDTVILPTLQETP